MSTLEMPRKDKEFRLDDRILDALKHAARKAGMSINGYVESVLFNHLKGAGELPLDAEPLPEARGGARPNAGKKPKKSARGDRAPETDDRAQ